MNSKMMKYGGVSLVVLLLVGSLDQTQAIKLVQQEKHAQ